MKRLSFMSDEQLNKLIAEGLGLDPALASPYATNLNYAFILLMHLSSSPVTLDVTSTKVGLVAWGERFETFGNPITYAQVARLIAEVFYGAKLTTHEIHPSSDTILRIREALQKTNEPK